MIVNTCSVFFLLLAHSGDGVLPFKSVTAGLTLHPHPASTTSTAMATTTTTTTALPTAYALCSKGA